MSAQSWKRTLLIIDDDRVFCDAVRDYFSDESVDVVAAHTVADGRAVFTGRRVDVVLLDQKLPDGEGHSLCTAILEYNDETKIIFATAFPSFEHAVKALKAGAHDYLSKPFELEELGLAVRQALRMIELERYEQLQNYERSKAVDEAVIIGGKGLSEALRLVELAATTDSPVLITGETGTGKTLAAKAIHYRRGAAQAPFVSINCAALPETLIEAELFGYEKGAFTGAVASKRGLIEMAEGGTIFLDEIGEMPLHTQAKLLGILEDRQVRRLGGVSSRPVSVRIIAATGVNMDETLGRAFRKDLYYRLSVIRIHLPPLRERREDVPLLCDHLVRQLTSSRVVSLDASEYAVLARYDWPGNVRELKNLLERAVLLQKGEQLRPSELLGDGAARSHVISSRSDSGGETIDTLADLEQRHIRFALGQRSGNLSQTARALDISLSTLKRKLKQMD
ncbi:MAG: hypothetical protein A2X56_12890 [Nitrospirae bacterium GWC2_57_13]|nr:MAG: hypothetical protein A2X56_12890 [Nitrospirae bacterium GWC2_57_13]OGW45072.1 MAG: hypothetical protein A2X57_02525 [Nitrospirae bacterium GWD2_57_8]HAR46380.1 hypothetical protein [Nitrospiraceae bacterium]